MGGQPHPDVGDQRRPAGRPLLEDVEDVTAVQDGEVAAVPGAVDEGGERTAGDPAQRLLPGVAGADLEGRDAEAVAPVVGRCTTKPSSIIVLTRWYAVLRGRSHARMIRSSGTGSGWLARKRSTRRVREAAGTWLIRPARSGASLRRGGSLRWHRCSRRAGRGRSSRARRASPGRPRDGRGSPSVAGVSVDRVPVGGGVGRRGLGRRGVGVAAVEDGLRVVRARRFRSSVDVPVVDVPSTCRWSTCRWSPCSAAWVPVVAPEGCGSAASGSVRSAAWVPLTRRVGGVVLGLVVDVGVEPVGGADLVLVDGLVLGDLAAGGLGPLLGTLGLEPGLLGLGLGLLGPGLGVGDDRGPGLGLLAQLGRARPVVLRLLLRIDETMNPIRASAATTMTTVQMICSVVTVAPCSRTATSGGAAPLATLGACLVPEIPPPG